MKTNIRAIIFDFDGTLVDSIEDIADSINFVFHKNQIPVHPVSDYRKWIGDGLLSLMERATNHVQISAEKFHSLTFEAKNYYADHCLTKTCMYEGIADLLNQISKQKISMNILSNKPHAMTVQMVDALLNNWKFDYIFGQREKVEKKPDPAAANEIASLLKISPHEILFIGDSTNDILTAQNAGMIPLGVTWGYGKEDEIKAYAKFFILNKASDVLKYLKE